eukprot:s995_g39.t1
MRCTSLGAHTMMAFEEQEDMTPEISQMLLRWSKLKRCPGAWIAAANRGSGLASGIFCCWRVQIACWRFECQDGPNQPGEKTGRGSAVNGPSPQ